MTQAAVPIALTHEWVLQVLGLENIVAKATLKAKEEGIWTDDNDKAYWWTGFCKDIYAAIVTSEGFMSVKTPDTSFVGVRPTLLYSDIPENLREQGERNARTENNREVITINGTEFIIGEYENDIGIRVKVAITKDIIGCSRFHKDGSNPRFEDTEYYQYCTKYFENLFGRDRLGNNTVKSPEENKMAEQDNAKERKTDREL